MEKQFAVYKDQGMDHSGEDVYFVAAESPEQAQAKLEPYHLPGEVTHVAEAFNHGEPDVR